MAGQAMSKLHVEHEDSNLDADSLPETFKYLCIRSRNLERKDVCNEDNYESSSSETSDDENSYSVLSSSSSASIETSSDDDEDGLEEDYDVPLLEIEMSEEDDANKRKNIQVSPEIGRSTLQRSTSNCQRVHEVDDGLYYRPPVKQMKLSGSPINRVQEKKKLLRRK